MTADPGLREMGVRAVGLYGPVAVAFALALGRQKHRRMFASALLGTLWVAMALAALQAMNLAFGWWSFQTAGPAFIGMPVELYLGWCCLWGTVPALLFRRMPVPAAIAMMVSLDLVLMPLCAPVVLLGRRWLIGEAVASVMVLAPGLLLARWTLEDRRLAWRAVLQIVTSAGIFLFLLPEIAFALKGGGWQDVRLHGRALSLALQGIGIFALLGISAVQEFVERGRGTPIPYDPPRNLVTSGIYRFVANPMQLGCTLTIVACGGLLGNVWIVFAGVISGIYSAGIARWDERQDLRTRFGLPWVEYRAEVRDWRIRWRPFVAQPARVYIARGCQPCSALRRWIEARRPAGLEIFDAEEYPGGLFRMRYLDDGVAEDGIRALARVFEHLNFAWAMAGAAMRLPGVRWLVQVVADGAGFGERPIGCALPMPRTGSRT